MQKLLLNEELRPLELEKLGVDRLMEWVRAADRTGPARLGGVWQEQSYAGKEGAAGGCVQETAARIPTRSRFVGNPWACTRQKELQRERRDGEAGARPWVGGN